MRGHPRPDRFVLGILDTELLAGGLDHMRHAWVVDVTDSGEQVVLDLEIQPPEKPRGYAALAGEVHRRLHLMHRPAGRQSLPASVRPRGDVAQVATARAAQVST